MSNTQNTDTVRKRLNGCRIPFRDIGKEAGVQGATVARLANGQSEPLYITVSAISRALDRLEAKVRAGE